MSESYPPAADGGNGPAPESAAVVPTIPHKAAMSAHRFHDWCHLCGVRSALTVDIWYPDNAEHDPPVRPGVPTSQLRYVRVCEACGLWVAAVATAGRAFPPNPGGTQTARRPGLTLDGHRQVGSALKGSRDGLVRLVVELAGAYGKSGRVVALARKAADAVDKLRCELDGIVARETTRAEWDAGDLGRVYYPGPSSAPGEG